MSRDKIKLPTPKQVFGNDAGYPITNIRMINSGAMEGRPRWL